MSPQGLVTNFSTGFFQEVASDQIVRNPQVDPAVFRPSREDDVPRPAFLVGDSNQLGGGVTIVSCKDLLDCPSVGRRNIVVSNRPILTREVVQIGGWCCDLAIVVGLEGIVNRPNDRAELPRPEAIADQAFAPTRDA